MTTGTVARGVTNLIPTQREIFRLPT